jgi:hypothetical protein
METLFHFMGSVGKASGERVNGLFTFRVRMILQNLQKRLTLARGYGVRET